MKRAFLLLAVWTLGLAAPALAAPWNARRAPRQAAAPAVAAFAGGSLELAQRDARPDPVRPDPRADPRPAAPPQPAAPRVSPEQAYATINRSTPGRQLNTEVVNRNGQPFYDIRWQTNDGRRIDYVVDGTSGQIVSSKGG